MLGKLFLLFTLVPLVELYLLIKVGAVIGPLPTILLVILTGAVGAVLARTQGLRVLSEFQLAMQEGRPPGRELIEGVLVLIGGAALLTPGIITDILGLSLIAPISRRFYARFIGARLVSRALHGRTVVHAVYTKEN